MFTHPLSAGVALPHTHPGMGRGPPPVATGGPPAAPGAGPEAAGRIAGPTPGGGRPLSRPHGRRETPLQITRSRVDPRGNLIFFDLKFLLLKKN